MTFSKFISVSLAAAVAIVVMFVAADIAEFQSTAQDAALIEATQTGLTKQTQTKQIIIAQRKGPGGYRPRKSKRRVVQCNGKSRSSCCAGLKSCSCTSQAGYGDPSKPQFCEGRAK